ncbi:MAG: cardiolipin synthase [Bacteroidales bacterium]|nr:cardiolipin synthase [Bacteroidales bacterium]
MIFEILYLLIIISSIVLVIMENRKPGIAIFWVMILIFLPAIGLVFYFIFGKNHRSTRVIRPDEMRILADLRNKACQSHITNHPPDDKYTKLADMMHNANDAPLFLDNDVRIFTDFTPMFQSLLDDISHATRYVHIQFYKIEDDEVGRELANLLIAKAQQGLDVRLMYDSFANLFVRRRYYDHMSQGGVKVKSFLKFIPSMFTRDVNCRTHRKIVVIDGHIGYTGGMNIARRYRDGIHHGIWRDTHIRIEGSAAAQLEVALLADWRFCTKELLDRPDFFPQVSHLATSPAPVQIVTSGPMDEWDTVMQGMVQIIAQSRRYLYLQSPYFIPSEPILLALRNAALAGVDVRLMLPDTDDRGVIMLYASESYFQDVLDAGVKVYLYHKGYLHAKTMVCDDDFLTIGSTNIDSRSFGQNFEVNAFIYSPELAIHQREIFLADMAECTAVSPADWPRRPLTRKFANGFARLLTPLL